MYDVVRTYADIELGRTDIQFATDGMTEDQRGEFIGDTMDDMGAILQSSSGRELVRQLAYQEDDRLTTTIYQAPDHDNPDTQPSYFQGAERGAAAEVSYEPGYAVDRPDRPAYWHPYRSDVTLYHELTHALHYTNGSDTGEDGIYGGEICPRDRGVEEHEYQAAGLGDYRDEPISEKVYRLERQRIARSGRGIEGDADMPDRPTYNSPTSPDDHCHTVPDIQVPAPSRRRAPPDEDR